MKPLEAGIEAAQTQFAARRNKLRGRVQKRKPIRKRPTPSAVLGFMTARMWAESTRDRPTPRAK